MIVSVNGHLTNQISVHDRGVMFGESLYEVIAFYHHKPYQLEQHLKRLSQSFKTLYNHQLNLSDIRNWIFELLSKMPKSEFTAIYLQCSTGHVFHGRSHLNHHKIIPTIVLFEYVAHLPQYTDYKKGFNAILFPDIRSAMANHKSTQLSINTIALNQAQSLGYSDAIFIKDKYITEAASSNFFAVKDGALITPPLGNIVPGVTRESVLTIAQSLNIPYEIRPICIKELAQCDEIFLSSSIKILKPIIEIDQHYRISNTGPIWSQLFKQYLINSFAYAAQNKIPA
ncbi:aminotransferase class IV [Gammaproteobacteria bacterium]|nr:aminotransferase class IV [Gammaproteobacteria bacterium]